MSDETIQTAHTSSGHRSYSIAICTYRRTEDCLDTLRLLAPVLPPDGEVLIVDQTPLSQLRESAMAIRLPVPLHYLHHSPPGLTPARNRAIREADGRIIIFLDDDVEPAPELIAAHLAAYLDPRVGGVAGRVRHSWETPTTDPYHRIHDPVFGWTKSWFNHTTRMPVPTARGCNMSFRTEILRDIGGFDERLLYYRDDTDVSFRVRALGHQILYLPEADLLHLQSLHGGTRLGQLNMSSFRNILRRELSYQKHFADDLYFILKHFKGSARWRLIHWATLERYSMGYRLPHRLMVCAQLPFALLRAAIRRIQPAKGIPVPGKPG